MLEHKLAPDILEERERQPLAVALAGGAEKIGRVDPFQEVKHQIRLAVRGARVAGFAAVRLEDATRDRAHVRGIAAERRRVCLCEHDGVARHRGVAHRHDAPAASREMMKRFSKAVADVR